MPPQVVYKPVGKEKTTGMIVPPKFMPTYYEWLLTRGIQITVANETIGSGNFYSVPKGSTLFITSVFISITNESVNPCRTIIHITSTANTTSILSCNCAPNDNSANQSTSHNYPIKIESNEKLYLHSSLNAGNCYIRAGVTGFLIKVNNIPQI